MRNIRTAVGWLALTLLGFACNQHAQTPSQNAAAGLRGTSWQLVKFQGSDDTTLTPDDRSNYTIAFDGGEGISMRIDCNRGHGTWTSAGPNQLQFGPMALTRAMCPPAPLNDRVARDWQYVRSYIMKDGHLFLSLMADGGTYEYEPITTSGSAPASADQQSGLQGLPASFVGTLPCADCPGIHYQLDLKPDHTFASQMIYAERDATFNDSGRWELANDGTMLVLQGKGKATQKFRVRDTDTLRKLDVNGNEIVSQFNYDLKRAAQSATAGNKSAADAPLENTRWKLAAVGATSVSADSVQNEAFLLLDPQQHRARGSGGCNRLTGSYELNGDQLKFGQMAGTMMMCPRGMDTEQAFFKSLDQVSSWKITGPSLALFDSDGNVLARFDASPMQ